MLWYNTKAVAKDGNRSLKIEQQEISTKQNCKCEILISSIELYILNKVKEAKINSSKEDFNSARAEIR